MRASARVVAKATSVGVVMMLATGLRTHEGAT
jgi:hypothetical protein